MFPLDLQFFVLDSTAFSSNFCCTLFVLQAFTALRFLVLAQYIHDSIVEKHGALQSTDTQCSKNTKVAKIKQQKH
jgi:hypothetical protein